MKIILLLIVIGIGGLIAPRERATLTGKFSLRNIRTDKIETYQPTAFCWWCSCYVSDQIGNPHGLTDYLKLIAKE